MAERFERIETDSVVDLQLSVADSVELGAAAEDRASDGDYRGPGSERYLRRRRREHTDRCRRCRQNFSCRRITYQHPSNTQIATQRNTRGESFA